MSSDDEKNTGLKKNYLQIKLCDMENLLTVVVNLRMNNLKNCHKIEDEINKMAEEQISLIRNQQKTLLGMLYEKGDMKNKLLAEQEEDLQYCIEACKEAIQYTECLDINNLEKDEKINRFIDKINFVPLVPIDRKTIVFDSDWEVLKNVITKIGKFNEDVDNNVGALLPPPITVLENVIDDKNDEVLAYTSPLSFMIGSIDNDKSNEDNTVTRF
uniref:Mediator complex subunit 4 n=1 Tax=Strongyloides papillosus TaxID=174720 RepID=A0A0N5BZP3_STREA